RLLLSSPSALAYSFSSTKLVALFSRFVRFKRFHFAKPFFFVFTFYFDVLDIKKKRPCGLNAAHRIHFLPGNVLL
ncbi:hypothetical protein, partial [Staphylococcus sp. EG-SA-1]|uniref:hypothetical protein n=1 Tax=Staphylococcus sp. EG-SA-1 TaxID=2767484 RepID=UPI00197CC029